MTTLLKPSTLLPPDSKYNKSTILPSSNSPTISAIVFKNSSILRNQIFSPQAKPSNSKQSANLMPIHKSVYAIVRERAIGRCEYCHYPELLSTSPLSVDHPYPQFLGGTNDLTNLVLACRRCNERRYNFITGIDSLTNQETQLFNGRACSGGPFFRSRRVNRPSCTACGL